MLILSLMSLIIVTLVTIIISRQVMSESEEKTAFGFDRLEPVNCDINVYEFVGNVLDCTSLRWSNIDNNPSIECCKSVETKCILIREALIRCDIPDKDFYSTIQYEIRRVLDNGLCDKLSNTGYDKCYKQVLPNATQSDQCNQYIPCNANDIYDNPFPKRVKSQKINSSLSFLWILIVILLILVLISVLVFIVFRYIKTESVSKPSRQSSNKLSPKRSVERSVRSRI